MNHYPLPTAAKLPSHAAQGDTANAHGAITCPHCRDSLSRKVAAHLTTAATAKGQERKFFEGDAANWQAVLDRVA